MTNFKKKPLRGIVPPMISPLKDWDTLDIKGLENLIEHILKGGVNGLFILGTTGEAPSLSYDLRYELIERVCDQVEKRVPVLVGITDTSAKESILLSEKAAGCGADAVVSAPPYYFGLEQVELVEFYLELADQLALPLFLYNIPSRTHVSFDLETIKQISENERVIGFKDSSGDLVYFQKVLGLMKDHPEFSLLVGPEEILIQSVLSGGHGGVNGGANLFPRLYVKMYEAAVKKDFSQMELLQEHVLKISSTIYNVGQSGTSGIQGIKCALSLMEICSDFMALPLRSFNRQQTKTIHQYLKDMKWQELLEFEN